MALVGKLKNGGSYTIIRTSRAAHGNERRARAARDAAEEGQMNNMTGILQEKHTARQD